jgi:hypothetical protein
MTSLWLPWRFVRVFPTIRCYGTNWLHQIPNPFFIEGNGIVKDLICYCFDYSVDDITQDYLANGKSTIMDKIQIEKKFGNCQCATKNPKGKWCLGDVRQVVDKLSGTWECFWKLSRCRCQRFNSMDTDIERRYFWCGDSICNVFKWSPNPTLLWKQKNGDSTWPKLTFGGFPDTVSALDEKNGWQVSGGVFPVTSTGYAVVEIQSKKSLSNFRSFEITLEPAGGSSTPTGHLYMSSHL